MDGAVLLIPIICSLGFFAMVVLVVWASTSAKNRRAALQADVQTRLGWEVHGVVSPITLP